MIGRSHWRRRASPKPSPGRRDADVALVAGRFKANIESLLQLYPEILAKHPELFDGSDIDLKSFALLGPDSKQGNGNLTVPLCTTPCTRRAWASTL